MSWTGNFEIWQPYACTILSIISNNIRRVHDRVIILSYTTYHFKEY